MIKINLLIKRPPLVRWRVVLQIGVAFALLGIAGTVAFTGVAGYRKLAGEVAGTKRLLDDYQQVAGKLPALQKERATVQARQSALAKIERNQRFSQSDVLRQVGSTPTEVWLVNVDFSGTDVIISGEARTFAGAMQYLNYLRSASLLQGVTEQSLTATGSGIVSFTYAAHLLEGVTKP